LRKILVTGGAGYIGSVLTEKLLQEGHQVTVIDDFRYNETSLNHLVKFKNLSIINSDVRDFGNYSKSFSSADMIIPLAALVGAPIVKNREFDAHSINVKACQILFSNASKHQFFIMPTTNSAYGKGDVNGLCTEESKLFPISKYATDKVELEKQLFSQTSAVSLRLATVFGSSPRMRTDLLVNDFVLRAVRDSVICLFESNFRRNYIHVQDVSNAILHMINNHEKAAGNIFNVGLTEANMTKLQLCERIKRHVPSLEIVEVPFAKDPDQRDYEVSNEKIEKFGFTTTVNLDDGIEELIKLYSMQRKFHYGNV
jgi:nucleoside-diphosphate-sugar epimerase